MELKTENVIKKDYDPTETPEKSIISKETHDF
jgi:hypothetical protein